MKNLEKIWYRIITSSLEKDLSLELKKNKKLKKQIVKNHKLILRDVKGGFCNYILNDFFDKNSKTLFYIFFENISCKIANELYLNLKKHKEDMEGENVCYDYFVCRKLTCHQDETIVYDSAKQNEFSILIDKIIDEKKSNCSDNDRLIKLYCKDEIYKIVHQLIETKNDIKTMFENFEFIKNCIITNSCYVAEIICSYLELTKEYFNDEDKHTFELKNKCNEFIEIFYENKKLFCAKKIEKLC